MTKTEKNIDIEYDNIFVDSMCKFHNVSNNMSNNMSNNASQFIKKTTDNSLYVYVDNTEKNTLSVSTLFSNNDVSSRKEENNSLFVYIGMSETILSSRNISAYQSKEISYSSLYCDEEKTNIIHICNDIITTTNNISLCHSVTNNE